LDAALSHAQSLTGWHEDLGESRVKNCVLVSGLNRQCLSPPYGGRPYNSPNDRALHGWCETNCRTISFMFGSSGLVNYKYS